MKNFIKYFKNSLSIVVAILIIAVVFIPYIIIIFYLRKNGQTIQIFPTFKIKEITRTSEVDSGILNDSIQCAEEILKKIKGEKE